MGSQRRANLVLALSSIAAVQSNFDTPFAEADLDASWAMTSDSYPNISREIDRILDCQQQDLVAKEELRRLMRFQFDYEADPLLMAVHLAYAMSVAAAPTGTPANQTQVLTRDVGVTAGTFKVGIAVGSVVKQTPPVAWNITDTDLKSAIEAIGFIGRGNTTVVFNSGARTWTIVYVNNLARAQMPQFTVDSTGLTGGAVVQSQTQPGVQKHHNLTRIAGFQPVAFCLAAGFRNSARLPKFYKSVVADAFGLRGSHAQPRVQASMTVIGSGEVSNVSSSYVIPTCRIYRPVRFRDCVLVIDGHDYSLDNTFRDFDLNYSNGLIADDDAYTAADQDVHRLERADQRPWVLNVGILGEEGDTIHQLGEALAEVAVTFRVGRSGNNINFNLPKASISLRDPVIVYDGTPKRSKVQISIEPELISGDATTPWTASAEADIASTLLAVGA